MDEDKIMNEIILKGTVFNAKQLGILTKFRLSFYNGKNKNKDFNPNGYIECKCFENVTFGDKEKIIAVGCLRNDYWEYQGKKYSQLCVLVDKLIRGDDMKEFEEEYKKKHQKDNQEDGQDDAQYESNPIMDNLWGESVIQDDGIPF